MQWGDKDLVRISFTTAMESARDACVQTGALTMDEATVLLSNVQQLVNIEVDRFLARRPAARRRPSRRAPAVSGQPGVDAKILAGAADIVDAVFREAATPAQKAEYARRFATAVSEAMDATMAAIMDERAAAVN